MARKKKEKAASKNPYIQLLPSTGGRPRKTLTEAGWNLVSTLSQLRCTDEEIADALCGNTNDDDDNITVDVLTNEYNKQTFTEKKRKGWNKGKTSLRSWQMMSAKNGNVTMQIFLGKNWLGQSDKQEIEVQDTQININVSAATENDVIDD